MENRRLLQVGILGTALVALCCFTPLLVVLFAAVGLSAAVGWLDYVLLPALVAFAGITGYALLQRQRGCAKACEVQPEGERRDSA